MENFYNIVHGIAEERSKHIKDYIVESPFIDRKTNKPIKTVIPYFIVIDSFSLMQSSEENKLFEKHNLSDSETNMVYMNDGRNKSKFMRQIPLISHKGGLHIMVTAHLGKKHELNPYGDKSKELQYLRQSDTIKYVGSQFGFLTNTLLETSGTKSLLDSNKECYYISEYNNSPPTELNKTNLTICRCKNNISGLVINPVISQYFGILNGVSNFEFLKNMKFGISGNNISKTIAFYPDLKILRNKLRSELRDNYEFYRALEIMSQICFIKSFWLIKTPELAILNEKSIEVTYKLLIYNISIKLSDILNS